MGHYGRPTVGSSVAGGGKGPTLECSSDLASEKIARTRRRLKLLSS